MSEDRLSFEEAARELGVPEDELERLVADGQIASIKEGDNLYFKREILEAFKNQDEEPAILLSDEEMNLLEDDEEIDFGIDLGEGEKEEEAARTERKTAPAAASSEGETDEISFDDEELPEVEIAAADSEKEADPEETVVSMAGVLDDESPSLEGDDESGLLEDSQAGALGEDTLLDTDVLDLGTEDTDTFDLDTAEETLIDPTEEGTLLRGGGARVMQMKRKQSHAAWTAVLAGAAFVLLLPMSVLLSMVYVENLPDEARKAGASAFEWIEKYNFLHGVVESLAKLFQ